MVFEPSLWAFYWIPLSMFSEISTREIHEIEIKNLNSVGDLFSKNLTQISSEIPLSISPWTPSLSVSKSISRNYSEMLSRSSLENSTRSAFRSIYIIFHWLLQKLPNVFFRNFFRVSLSISFRYFSRGFFNLSKIHEEVPSVPNWFQKILQFFFRKFFKSLLWKLLLEFFQNFTKTFLHKFLEGCHWWWWTWACKKPHSNFFKVSL